MTTGVSWKQATAKGCTSQWAEQHKLKPKRVRTGIRGKAAGFLRSPGPEGLPVPARSGPPVPCRSPLCWPPPPSPPAERQLWRPRAAGCWPDPRTWPTVATCGEKTELSRGDGDLRRAVSGTQGPISAKATTLPRAEPMEMVPTQDGVQHPLPTSASPLPATGCTHPALIKQFISVE